jgi:hypothetical protein
MQPLLRFIHLGYVAIQPRHNQQGTGAVALGFQSPQVKLSGQRVRYGASPAHGALELPVRVLQ